MAAWQPGRTAAPQCGCGVVKWFMRASNNTFSLFEIITLHVNLPHRPPAKPINGTLDPWNRGSSTSSLKLWILKHTSMPPIFCVDAFTSKPFSGNPAAVCLLSEHVDPEWMQKLANEFGLSETAFLVPTQSGFGLRWFTPSSEVDLCGHATLASAHVLWENNIVAAGVPIEFHTRSGMLTAWRRNGWIVLDFPAVRPMAASAPYGLSKALGIPVSACYRNTFDCLIPLEDAFAVRRLQPDFDTLAAIDVRGVIVTAPSADPDIDFVSRFFAPAVGVPEDPVTGSAHCALGPYWASLLGKNKLVGYQASTRGGIVKVVVNGDRVDLSGRATTIWQGSLSPAAAPK